MTDIVDELTAALKGAAGQSTPPPAQPDLQAEMEAELKAAKAAPPAPLSPLPMNPMTTTPQDLQEAADRPPPLAKTESIAESLLAIGKNRAMDVPRLAIGAKDTALSAIKAPGQAAEAIQNYGSPIKFEPTWNAPISSALVGLSRITDKLDKEFLPQIQDYTPESAPWYDSISYGAGSAAAFMGGGALLKAAGWGVARATAALGGAVGASNQYEDALAHGATPNEAGLAYLGGGVFGLSEAVSGSYFLNKFDKMTNGALFDKISKYNSNDAPSVLKDVVMGFITEGGQEGFQQLGGNWVARDLAGYDPRRSLGENFWESVATGGLIGSTIAGGIGLFEKSRYNKTMAAFEAARQAKLDSGDPINDIMGPFTPVETAVNLRKLRDDLEKELTQTGEAHIQSLGDAAILPTENSGISATSVPPEVRTPNISGPNANEEVFTYVKNLQVDSNVETALVGKEKKPMTVEEGLKLTPVVAVQSNTYSELIQYHSKSIKSAVEKIKADPNDAEAKNQLQDSVEKLKALQEKRDFGIKRMKEIKNYVASFVESLMPDLRVILTDGQLDFNKGDEKLSGFVLPVTGVSILPGTTTTILNINLDKLVTDDFYNKATGSKKDTTVKDSALFETLTHELGHAFTDMHLHSLVKTIRNATAPEAERKRALAIFSVLQQEYNTWLEETSGKTMGDILATLQPPVVRKAALRSIAKDLFVSEVHPEDTARLFGFDEFFADQVSRLATQGKLSDPIMTKFFEPILDGYAKFYESAKAQGNTAIVSNEASPGFTKFLKSIMLQTQLKNEMEKIMAGNMNQSVIRVLRHGLPGFNRENFAGLQQHLDHWNKGMQWGFNLIQMIKENPHIIPLQEYGRGTEAWAAYQRNTTVEVIDTVTNWKDLGKLDASALADVLYEEGFSNKFIAPDVLSKRLSGEALVVYKQVREQLNRMLEEMRQVSLEDAQKSFGDNAEKLAAEVKEINSDFDKMKARAYFPFLRFGKFTLTIRALEDLKYNGQEYKKGALISFPVFEKEKERDAAHELIQDELKEKASISPSIMEETEFAIQGMPRSMIRTLKSKLMAAGEMTDAQEVAINQALKEVDPFRNFKKQFLKKKKMQGYSQDAMRSFAYYMRSGVGHVARVKHADVMREARKELQDQVNVLKEIGARAQDRQEIKHWLDRHFNYVMTPTNEWAALRGAMFVGYLGFNIKSAFVNLTQIVTTVGPYLAARHGDVKALAALSRATWVLKDWVQNRKGYIAHMKLSQEGYWKLYSTLGVRVGDVTDGSHYATLGGAEDFRKGLEDHEEAKFFDLSAIKTAPPTEEVWKQILMKTLELEQAGQKGNLQGGQIGGGILGTKPMLPSDQIVSLITEMLATNDTAGIDSTQNEELGLYRGAQALGYDAVYLMEENEYFDSESTLNIFQNAKAVKEISKAEYHKRQLRLKDGIPDNKRRLALMLQQGLHEGWIDQSLATELAVAASENNLDRSLFIDSPAALWHKAAGWSAKPFHLVEKMNRYITAIAAYELEYEKTKSHKKAVAAAKDANYAANYENARWNRPEFLRGKKSAALLFMNYVQNTLHFAVKDPGGTRYLLSMLILAGIMGLPGAEDVEDLVDFAVTGLNKTLGIKNPRFQMRQEIRKLLDEMSLSPDLFLHGLSQKSFGWGQIGELTGIPIPKFDLSGSVGMGNILPLTEIPGQMLQKNKDTVFANAVASASGAGGNFVKGYYDSLMSGNSDDWKNMEKLLPMMSLRNVSKAIRLYERGGEKLADGSVVSKFDTYDNQDLVEVIGQGLGFMPTRLSQGWERELAKKELVEYYKVQQQAVTSRYYKAILMDDREGIADSLKGVYAYNDIVPMPEMKLTGPALKAGALAYVKGQKVNEAGWAAQAKYRRLEKSLEETYPDPYGDTLRKGEAP